MGMKQEKIIDRNETRNPANKLTLSNIWSYKRQSFQSHNCSFKIITRKLYMQTIFIHRILN